MAVTAKRSEVDTHADVEDDVARGRRVLPRRAVRARGGLLPLGARTLPRRRRARGQARARECSATTGLAAGEQQHDLFIRLFARERLLAGPDVVPPTEAPPDLADGHRDGLAALAHDAAITLGRAAGALGSFVLGRATNFAGRLGTNDAVWTNWHSSGDGLPGPLAKAVRILKLAHMRETLFANNLVRPYPDGAKTAFFGTVEEPPPRGVPVADGGRELEQRPARRRRSLRPHGGRGVHAVLP